MTKSAVLNHCLGIVSSVIQLCLTLCDPIDCSTPDFPVHPQLLELAQTHVHRPSDAIQPSHLLSFPSPPAFNLSQHQGFFFQWSVLCIRWPKYWSLGIVAMYNYHRKIVVIQGCIFSPLFNLHAEYIMQNGRSTSWNQPCLEKYQ